MDEALLHAATENFSLPHDVISLPSGGTFYKSKKKSVKIGYLTASDENVIISSAFNNKDNFVLNLIRNKLYEHDLRPDELLEGDVEAILIFLRNTSFGSEYTVKIEDPATKKMFDVTVVLDELNIKQTKHKPNEEGLFVTKLPKTEADVKLRLLTYSEIIEINKMADEYPQGRVAPRIQWRLQRQIVEINGERDKGYISKFIEQLPIMDSKYIRTFLSDNQPSLDLTRQVKAPSGEIATFTIAFGVEFFRPFF